MKSLCDIMVKDVVCVNDSDTVFTARMRLKEKGIRHLPVVDSKTGDFLGLLTQRSLLNHAFNIVEKFGLNGLEKREQRTLVSEIMLSDCETISPDADLLEVAENFTHKKNSCLPVVENNSLLGIVTSVDFVKLALYLLKQQA